MECTCNPTLLISTWSPGMLASYEALVKIKSIDLDSAKALLGQDFTSGIGHPGTAAMAASLLGVDLPAVDPKNRVKVAMQPGDRAIVVQYVGRRLAEGEILNDPNPNDFTLLSVEVVDVDELAKNVNWAAQADGLGYPIFHKGWFL